MLKFEIFNGSPIAFGIAENKTELEEIFRFRYEMYVRARYVKNHYPDRRDIDNYDINSVHFIARLKETGTVVGGARLIQEPPLPTPSEYYKFTEPAVMSGIKKAEISRVIANKVDGSKNAVLIGLFAAMHYYSQMVGIEGAYASLKDSFLRRLRLLGIPIHIIGNTEYIYKGDLLEGYFDSKNNPVRVIYVLADEVEPAIKRLLARFNTLNFPITVPSLDTINGKLGLLSKATHFS